MPDAAAGFLAARDVLLRHRTDYDAAIRAFSWPALDRFNWALDYFDSIAAGNSRPALHIVEQDGAETIRSFAELSAASNRVANYLRSLGARRGDRLLLMLGNQLPLWETFLGAMKLGLVLSPATTLLTRDDVNDRIARGGIRFVLADATCAERFADAPGEVTKICLTGEVRGWRSYVEHQQADGRFTPDGTTRAGDPCSCPSRRGRLQSRSS